ncbi:MAG: hypothetical protein ACTSWE_15205 [Promethearchaeota archaeon]
MNEHLNFSEMEGKKENSLSCSQAKGRCALGATISCTYHADITRVH